MRRLLDEAELGERFLSNRNFLKMAKASLKQDDLPEELTIKIFDLMLWVYIHILWGAICEQAGYKLAKLQASMSEWMAWETSHHPMSHVKKEPLSLKPCAIQRERNRQNHGLSWGLQLAQLTCLQFLLVTFLTVSICYT